MNNLKTQQGNTFYGLLIGIVLAALIIASILWYLNNNKTSFQTYNPPHPIPTTPDTLPHINNGQEPGENQAERILKDFSIDQSTVDQTTIDPASIDPNNTDQVIIATPKKDDIEVLISSIQTPAKSKNEPVKNVDNNVQNTPKIVEQILDGGSTKTSKDNNNKFVIQMGSFSTQEKADERKAELSLLNINSSVQQTEKNGQIMYRIRSTTLDQEEANHLQNTLKNQQIDNILIPLN